MPADEDKYPTQSGRRRFVKGVVGSAALAGVTAGSAAALESATNRSGAGGGPTQYVAIQLEDGPAPRGMPMIPIEIQDGELHGLWPEVSEVTQGGRTVTVAQQDVGGVTYSSAWFQYCGLQGFPSVQPGADADTTFLASSGYDWLEAEVDEGTPLTVDMFDDYEEWGNGIGRNGLGKPARGTWRNMEGSRPMPVQVLRTPELPKMIAGEGRYSSLTGPVRNFLDAATDQNFMAWLNKCTHFCCTPQGFKTSTYENADDRAYCQCHQSIYNPFSPVQKQFVALPRPGE